MKSFQILIFSVIFTLLGLAGGYFGAAQTKSDEVVGGHGHGHGHGDAHGHGHGGGSHPPHGDVGMKTLSPQALKNLGVTVKEVETQEFYKYTPVPAVVIEPRSATQPVVAPVGGFISDVHIEPGMMVESGSVLITIVRDAIPRPALTLTEEIIKPVSEEFHTTLGELRAAQRSVSLLKAELERVSKFTQGDQPVLPRKNEIDLRNELARAEQTLSNIQEKLSHHGFTEQQVADVASGKAVATVNAEVWLRALQRNGLWTNQTAAIYAALPDEIRKAPWSVAALGEMSASGLATTDLATWIKEDASAGAQFIAAASLLQQGTTLAQVKMLQQHGALNPVVEVRAPALKGTPDWDVQQVLVRRNERVEPGAPLAFLSDSQQMLLKVEPVGTELSALTRAIEQDFAAEAMPMTDQAGPPLSGLKLLNVFQGTLAGGDKAASTISYAHVQNKAMRTKTGPDQRKYRTWQLRAGQKYVLRVPAEKLTDVFVLPAEAVTDDGADKVVFVQNGDAFDARKVVVVHRDHKNVVIDSKHSDLFDGEPVVQQGAFGLGLALKTESGPVGHGHEH
ncbi:MAG TPA: efflux RND transporter periplasmic adaptor subunit [Planctomycetota bacterium]|nr:efflux RND transporter periplasmic adaptor subunit [Planctomycetota bacterium]